MVGSKARAIEVIPFRINNVEPFLGDREYPNYHPDSRKYDEYWTERTRECIYGIWGEDAIVGKRGQRIGGYRWLPGNIVFHTHHCVIEIEKPGQKAKGLGRPMLRDVEWFVGYDLAACDGFAGFSEDDRHTCFRPVGKLQAGGHITNAERMLIDQYGDLLHDSRGRMKKYVDAREYLYQTFEEPMGEPLWLNDSLNYMLLSTRRLGKSYIVINGISAYNFTFNGARTLSEYFNQTTKTTTVVGSGESSKTKEFFAKWQTTYDHLRTNVGSFAKGEKVWAGAWWNKVMGSVIKENSYLTDSVRAAGGIGYTGPGNKLWHVSYHSSPSKGAGFSMNDGIVEEVGLTPAVEDIHAENTPAQRSDRKFGKSTYIGTGGDFELIEQSKTMFHKPEAFEILPCRNLFVPGGSPTARFIPATYYPNQYRNEHGNQDVQAAFEDIMHERKKKERLDTLQYLRHKASYPLYPAEIFVKADGNLFPVAALEKRKSALEQGAVPHSVGRIAFRDTANLDAYWIEDFEDRPLWELDDLTDDNLNKRGAIVQYESPRPYRPERRYGDLDPMYLLCLEPVRNDVGTSFVYAYVWKFDDFEDPGAMRHNIVCEWFGRFDNDNDKNLRRVFDMAAYYGCNIYSEINNDSIKGMARRMRRTDWLQPDLGEIEGLGSKGKNRHKVGFYVFPLMNPGLEKLTNEFLRKEVDYTERIDKDVYTRERTMMADVINSRMVCDQCIHYNPDGNFDAYDGLRLIAVWYKANEKVDEQYVDTEADRKLLDLMKHIQRQRVASNRLNRKRSRTHLMRTR